MRVLFLVPHLSTGGMPQFLLKRIKALQKFTDIEVFVYEWTQISTWYQIQRKKIIEILPKDNFISGGYFAEWEEENSKRHKNFIKYLKDKKIDIVHLEEFPEKWPTWGGITLDENIKKELYSKKYPWKTVETLHSIDYNAKEKNFHPDGYAFVIDHHLKETFKILPGEKKLIEYPVDGSIISNRSKEDILTQQGWRVKGEHHIVNVGLWTPGKNQKYALEIAKILWDKYGWSYIFHFVGNQAHNFRDYWMPLMENLPPNIIIHGEKDTEEVSEFYKISDLMLFTSTWECNPIVLKEAISNNIKIMAFDLDHYRGVYTNFIEKLTGNLEEDIENLIDIIHSPIKYKPIKQNKLKEFAKKHLELYENIINRR